jgi:RNA recognition motif-containing protein
MSAKLYVGNLSFATTELDLQDLFAQAGTVVDVKIIQDKLTGKSRGFGFVTMGSDEQASEAISKFNGFSLDKDSRRGRDRDFRRR